MPDTPNGEGEFVPQARPEPPEGASEEVRSTYNECYNRYTDCLKDAGTSTAGQAACDVMLRKCLENAS